jgi:NADH-quinone oxidoreductase subunit D
VLKLDGERVVDAMPDIGYLHSGFEKIGEHLDYNQYVTVTDRMNYISPMANNVAWHGAVEKLLGIELTPRCKYIRVIVAELARISDHLLCTGAMGLDVGAFTFFLYAFYQREDLRHFRDALRRPVHQQLHARRRRDARHHAAGDREDSHFVRQDFPKTLDDMERLLNRNRIFVDRTKGVGVLTKEEAINRSAPGRSPGPAA